MAFLFSTAQRRVPARIKGRLTAIFLLALPLIIFPGAIQAKQPLRSIVCLVTKVTDGDTIQVTDLRTTKLRVRLYGIDAPEIERFNRKTGRISKPGQPYGEEARTALSGKLLHQRVKLDVIDIDRYQRLVCLVWLGNRNINKEMVAEGWAWAYRDYLNAPYASEFIDHEEQANMRRIGLWQQAKPEPPWEFRRALRIR